MPNPAAPGPLALLEELVEQLSELYTTARAEVSELRSELDSIHGDVRALSNRIESTTRELYRRTEQLV